MNGQKTIELLKISHLSNHFQMENLPHSLNPIAQCSSIAHTETHIEIHILDVKTFNVKRLTFHNNFDSNLNLQICATSFSTCNSLRKRTLMSWKFLIFRGETKRKRLPLKVLILIMNHSEMNHTEWKLSRCRFSMENPL